MARSLHHKHVTYFIIIKNNWQCLWSFVLGKCCAPQKHSKHGKSMPHKQNLWCFKTWHCVSHVHCIYLTNIATISTKVLMQKTDLEPEVFGFHSSERDRKSELLELWCGWGSWSLRHWNRYLAGTSEHTQVQNLQLPLESKSHCHQDKPEGLQSPPVRDKYDFYMLG